MRLRHVADRQMRALIAARFRRDRGLSSVSQHRAAKLLRASKRAESRYVHDVVAVMRGVHRGFLAQLELPKGEAPETRAAGGATPSSERRLDAARVQPALFDYVRKHVGPAFDKMKREVDRDNKEGLALIGIQPAMVPGLEGTLAHARENNIRLVQKAASDYAAQVDEVLRDPKNLGLRVEELRELLVERGNVSASRAELIARDQTLKTNAAVTKARQQAAGVASYRWSTSQDERVRPMHAELEGEKFDYDDPPVTNDAGDKNNPGEDFQCRCVAIPVIPELEEPGPELEEPEPEETPPEIPEPEPGPPEVEPGPPDVEELPPGPPELAELEELDPEASPPAPDDVEPPPRGPDDAGELGPEHFADVTVDPRSAMTVDEVLAGAKHEGLARWLETASNQPKLTIASKDIRKRGTEGLYQRDYQGARISINANAGVADAHQQQRGWGQIWRIADRGPQLRTASAATAEDKVRDSFLHEMGHHVHLGLHSLSQGVDGVVEAAYRRVGFRSRTLRNDVVKRGAPNPAISRYAAYSAAEYFAESFNAYLVEPAALKAHDPIGYGMVQDVLRRLKIEP